MPEEFLGVGDDCAILPLRPGRQWVTSTDLLLQGRHFSPDIDPTALGHKALAVNVSDLAAMGARPEACLLGLALPRVDEAWLKAFSEGFLAYAADTGCHLVGGDTTRSESGLQISVTVFGTVLPGQAMRRDAAREGDDIWVTGCLGGPHLAWQLSTGRWPEHASLLASAHADWNKPMPPWQLAQALAPHAHAALDISDGLAQDLGHILQASGCGARLYLPQMPRHPALTALPSAIQHEALLYGGEVYQLCFTASPAQRAAIADLGQQYGVPLTRVGDITRSGKLEVLDEQGAQLELPSGRGFDHFH